MNAAPQDQPRDEETANGATEPPQRPRNSISSFLFVSFILFMLTNHNGAEIVAQNQYREALRSFSWQLGNYSAWLNGTDTNFTMPTAPITLDPLVNTFIAPGTEVDPSISSYYSNITGYVRGSLKFHNLTSPIPSSANSSSPIDTLLTQEFMEGLNRTELVERLGLWNWSAPEKIGWNVVERLPPPSWRYSSTNVSMPKDIAMVHGRMDMSDPNTGDEMRFTFEGVHFIKNGTMYGFAEPGDTSPDIRLLPSLVPEAYANATSLIIEPELVSRIAKLRKQLDEGMLDFTSMMSADSNPHPHCPFTVFAQIAATDVPQSLMSELEEEILRPTGIDTVSPPRIRVDGVMVSRECGVLWELREGEGVRSKSWFRKVTTYAGSAALVYLFLLILLTRQMNISRTPANLSRLSRWSFLTQALCDSIFFAGHITFAIVAEGQPSVSLVAPAFLACVLFVYEAQFAILIFQIQAPEDAAPSPPAVVRTRSEGEGVEGVQTLTIADTPTTLNRFSSRLRVLLQHPPIRVWLVVSIFLLFIIRTILYPPLALFILGIMYAGLWIPQIYRSARRGRTSGLNLEYLVGTTAARMGGAMYFIGYKGNVLDIEARGWIYPLAGLLVLEVIIVLLQERLGPSFFLPSRLSHVPTYDYHPYIPLPDPEAPEQTLGDCSICMDAIVVDPSRSRRAKSSDGREPGDILGGGLLNAVQMGVGGVAGRKSYSLAPCHHLFHTECLEQWLAIKNICPQCRRPLPPL